MHQQFNLPPAERFAMQPAALDLSGHTEISTPGIENNPDFAGFSPQGQQTIRDYLVHLENALTSARPESVQQGLARAEVAREIQVHLLSLVVAYMEIGDEEPEAIRSAIAQFGAAREVSGRLRRVEKRYRRGRVDFAVIIPTMIFSLALMAPVLIYLFPNTTMWMIPRISFISLNSVERDIAQIAQLFGWPALFLLPFLAGALGGNLNSKRAARGLFLGAAFALGTALTVNWAFVEDMAASRKMQSELQFMLMVAGGFWLVNALLGMACVRATKALSHRRRVT